VRPADKDQLCNICDSFFTGICFANINLAVSQWLCGNKGSKTIEDCRGGGDKRRVAGGIG
jgi:hypothetical protein